MSTRFARIPWVIVLAFGPGFVFGPSYALHAEPALEVVAQEGGASYAVAVAGDTAYLVVGPRVVALDVSEPTRPTVIGRSAPLPRVPVALAVADGRVFAAAQEQGLWVLAPEGTSLRTVGHAETPAMDVAAGDGVIYVAADEGGLRVFDASSSGTPVEVGRLATARRAIHVAQSGGYVFVDTWVDNDRLLHVVGAADPTNLRQVASLALPDDFHMDDLVADGRALYAASNYGKVHVISVEDPLRPAIARTIELRGSPDLSASPDTLAVADGMAYVGGWTSGQDGTVQGFLWTVSLVAGPGREVQGRLATPYGVRGVALSGTTAFAADVSGGLRVVDVARPTVLREIASYDPPGTVQGVGAQAQMLYVASPDDGLGIYDVSDPRQPALRSSFRGDEEGLWIDGERLFAGGSGPTVGQRLDVYDISAPAAPAKRMTLPHVAPADLAVAGGFLYMTESWEGSQLSVWDISDAESPRQGPGTGVPAAAVRWAGDTLVTVGIDGELARLSLLDTGAAPRLEVLGTLRLPIYPESLEVVGHYAYVGAFPVGLLVIELSAPAVPRLVATVENLGSVGQLRLDGPVLFAQTEGGVAMIDVRRPCRPRLLASVELALDQHDTPGTMDLRTAHPGRLDAQGGTVFVGGQDGGFHILQATGLDDLPPPTEACSPSYPLFLPYAGR
jgi:hypothetical protein